MLEAHVRLDSNNRDTWGSIGTIRHYGPKLDNRSCLGNQKCNQLNYNNDVHFYKFYIIIIRLINVFFCLQTINDVITGMIFLGIRLYMLEIDWESSTAHSTALVLLNTRDIKGYKSVKEMVDKNGVTLWGNRFAFLHVPIPKLSDTKFANPLEFIWKAHKEIKKKKNSLATPLNAMFLNMVKKLRGPEVGIVRLN